jgi:hypothetical protein
MGHVTFGVEFFVTLDANDEIGVRAEALAASVL